MMIVAQAELKAGDLIIGYRSPDESSFYTCNYRLVEIRNGSWRGYYNSSTSLINICSTTGLYEFQIERGSARSDLVRLLGVSVER